MDLRHRTDGNLIAARGIFWPETTCVSESKGGGSLSANAERVGWFTDANKNVDTDRLDEPYDKESFFMVGI